MIRWVVRSAAPVFLAVLFIFIFGLVSYVTMPREAAPDVKVPFVLVTTPYVGVSPADIESLVTVPVENELAGVKGLKTMKSTSSEGVSSVFLEFEPDVVIEDALQKVRDRVNRAKTQLPEDVEEPVVREISFTDIPVMIVTIAGPVDGTVLKQLAEDLGDEVARVPGVLEAEISGGAEREFQVLLDPGRMEHYGVTFGDVVDGLRGENQNIPGGNVKVGDGNVLLRVPAELREASEIEDAPVKIVGSNVVRVRDVARVKDGLADSATYARMDGLPAVSVRVKKRTGANLVGVADVVKEVAAKHAETWPEGVQYEILADQSDAIRDMVNELQNNILTALALVVAVILFFMGFRNSLFVALAIPLSMFGSFAILQMLGFTLNMVVLFALILALGMLVDNAIVVVENIYRHLEMGKGRWQAAIDGTKEVALAVAASTATTVAAFFPLVFWSGIMGQFMGYLPKTLIIVLTASLLVAVFILPVFASRFMTPTKRAQVDVPEGETPEEALARMEAQERQQLENPGRIMGWYKAVLQLSIRWRYLVTAGGVAGLFVTVGIYAIFNHGTEFFPATEPDRAVVSVRGPDGTDLQTTDRLVREIEGMLAEEPNIKTSVSEVGVAAGGGGRLLGTSSSPNSARITVDFLVHPAAADPGEVPRGESSEVTVLRLREKLALLTGAEITVEPQEMGPPVGNDIEIEVRGDDFELVGTVAQKLKRRVAAIDGISDITDDYKVNRPELALRIDRGAAKQAGVSTGLVGSTVRTAVAGSTATTIRDGEEEYDVVVKLAPEFTDDVQEVLDLRLPGRLEKDPNVYMVPMSTVASYELAGGSGAVRHIDQALTITVTGDVVEGFAVDQAQAAVRDLLDEFEFPPGVTATLGGASTEERKAQEFLAWAMMVAVALIAIVLVTQFNDLVQPLIIIMTVVLSLIGVLWGLLLTGTPFGVMMTGIGVISLAGVVVNNAIVLLDYVAQLRREGHAPHEALVRAGMTRFRPVMLTAITTVLGLVPMALGLAVEVGLWWVADAVPVPTLRLIVGSQSSAFWGPMAVAVIFGLSFATVLTLVMVPTLYSIYVDIMAVFRPRAITQALAKVAVVGLTGAALFGLSAPAEAMDLEEAWAAAREHNPDLAIVQESAFQARNQRIQAWALVQPRLSAAANYSYLSYGDVMLDMGAFFEPFEPLLPPDFEKPEPTVIQRGSNWDANLTVSQPLFNGSALPLLVGAYKQVDAAEYEALRTDQQIRAGVARAFYGLIAAREAVGLAEDALETSRSQLALAERQVDAGIATRRAILQGRLGVAQAERDLRSARERVAGAEEGFEKVTGVRASDELVGGLERSLPGSLEEARNRAEGNRPDVKAASLRADMARLQVRAEQLAWMPTIDARWTGIYNQTDGFAGENLYWQAGLAANWTLWDGGMRLATIRQAASQRRQADLNVDKAEADVKEDVVVAWEAYQRTAVSVAAVDDEVALASDSLDLARRGFEAGTVTFLEVEQAELALRRAELTRLNERMNLELAGIDLLVATGEL